MEKKKKGLLKNETATGKNYTNNHLLDKKILNSYGLSRNKTKQNGWEGHSPR